MTQEAKYVIIVGNPIDGLAIIGPFDSVDRAEDYAVVMNDYWWITTIEHPIPDGNDA